MYRCIRYCFFGLGNTVVGVCVCVTKILFLEIVEVGWLDSNWCENHILV